MLINIEKQEKQFTCFFLYPQSSPYQKHPIGTTHPPRGLPTTKISHRYLNLYFSFLLRLLRFNDKHFFSLRGMEMTMAPLCRLSKTKAITLANHIGREQSREPSAKSES